MRSNVETRRCGCGNLIGLRESCARCASAARARLHEAGIATMRGQENCRHARWRLSEDRCEVCGIGGEAARRQGRHPFAKQRYGVERDLFGSGEQRVVRYTREQLQAVTKKVFGDGWGDRLKAHQQRELSGGQYGPAEQAAVAALFRYLAMFEPHRRALYFQAGVSARDRVISEQDLWNRVNDRAAAFEQSARHEPPAPKQGPALPARMRAPHPQAAPEEPAPNWWRKKYDGEFVDKHELPAVGAEVDYATAMADMQRRTEARYQHTAANGTAWYRIDGGQLKSCRYSECNASLSGGYELTGTWVRLEDAPGSTLPAIGAEVSWERAKADMMVRSDARYRLCGPLTEYAWRGELVVSDGGEWRPSSYSELECANPLLRWVRLA